MGERFNNGRTLAVIGAGVVSLPVVEEFIRYHTGTGPISTLIWITGGRRPGESPAFAAAEPDCKTRLTLNQAAFEMGVSQLSPDSYTKWVAQTTGPDNPRYEFTERSLFGAYTKNYADKLLHEAQSIPSLRIDIRRTAAQSIEPDCNDGFDVRLADGSRLHADKAVIATGPAPSTALDHLNGQRGYIASSTDAPALRSLAQTSTNASAVTIYGGASSMIDAVTMLEGFGYRGAYQIVGRSMNLWASEPEKEDAARFDHLANFAFTAEQTDWFVARVKNKPDIHGALRELYTHQKTIEPMLGFRHVLNAFPRKEIAGRLHKGGHFAAAVEVWKYRDHVCAPGSILLLDRLRRQDRLVFTKARIEAITASANGGFDLHIKDNRRIFATTLINAMPFAKGADRNGILAPLIARKEISVDSSYVVATNEQAEAMPNLAVLGAASHTGPYWGVRSFQKKAHAAGLAAAQALRGPDAPRPVNVTQPVLSLPRIYPQQPQTGATHAYQ